ncbi:histidine triad nucleotide-binding protein [Peptostreptococcus canis]|uniref:Histidine triad nucleotide-binding protein n=1 Tax=Peptostreptococcus canis TaxID=1159213 RepID=A0ABR6TM67_9FIRM|nr:histidine triad nucleotide-binding protein [Peptostreptococcus canis]MBC2576516.1 histidine triad nucleotide-binding protein [Peptostreptococcus canis]MBP1998648.1 histidine triad (HIT) family protein [Peptostreptococcus canis]
MDCIFCKLANGEIPTNMVYEDERIAAFKDVNPVAPVHILVVPKKHYSSLEDVDFENMDVIIDIHKAIRKIAEQEGFSKNGYRIINNCGKDGGQEVPHIHYHVLAGKQLTKLVTD